MRARGHVKSVTPPRQAADPIGEDASATQQRANATPSSSPSGERDDLDDCGWRRRGQGAGALIRSPVPTGYIGRVDRGAESPCPSGRFCSRRAAASQPGNGSYPTVLHSRPARAAVMVGNSDGWRLPGCGLVADVLTGLLSRARSLSSLGDVSYAASSRGLLLSIGSARMVRGQWFEYAVDRGGHVRVGRWTRGL